MVPVKEAISSGAWLNCEYTNKENQTYKFRIKINSFTKLDLKDVDEPEKINNLDSNGEIWLMEIEFINLLKVAISPTYGTDMLILFDQDGFSFNCFQDFHLRCASEFSKSNNLYRFFSSELSPKIKAVGKIPFKLPNDDEAIYSISLKYEGVIVEA